MTMVSSGDATVDLLKSKAMLLLRRERELNEFRLARDRIESWLRVFHSLSEMLGTVEEDAILDNTADMLITHLGFEVVAVFRHRGRGAGFTPVCVFPTDRSVGELDAGVLPAAALRAASGTHESTDLDLTALLGRATGLEKFYWQSLPVGKGSLYILVAGFSPNAAAFHSLSSNDEGHFLMFGSHLAALLSNSELVEKVRRDRHELIIANTELDASLKEIRKIQEELVQSTRLASVGEMAGRMAHEVLNPITSIHGRITRMSRDHAAIYDENVEILGEVVRGWADSYRSGGVDELVASITQPVQSEGGTIRTLLDDDLETLGALHEYFAADGRDKLEGLGFLLRETDRVTRIIDGTRSLTRASASREDLRAVEVLKESGEALRDGLDKRNIALRIDADDSMVRADRYELIQVLTNLLRNAMFAIEEKAGREGGAITMSATRGDGTVEVRVADTGTGIAAENLPLIFESSFTTRSAQQGTGLGLSICKRLVRGFGGELSVEWTEVGRGTSFLIALPEPPSDDREQG